MQWIQNISNDPKQKHIISLEDGRQLTIELAYRPTQIGWFLDLEIEGWELRGIRITNSLNLLFQWHNIIDFGILCEVDNNQEPLSIQDFLVGRARLGVLDQSEVNDIISAASIVGEE